METGEVAQHLMSCGHCLERATVVEERIGSSWHLVEHDVAPVVATKAVVRTKPMVVARRRKSHPVPRLIGAAAAMVLLTSLGAARFGVSEATLDLTPPKISASVPVNALRMSGIRADELELDIPRATPRTLARQAKTAEEQRLAVFRPPVKQTPVRQPLLMEPPRTKVVPVSHASMAMRLDIDTSDLPGYSEKKRSALRRFFGKMAAPFRSSGS
jgi:hypothetical protein